MFNHRRVCATHSVRQNVKSRATHESNLASHFHPPFFAELMSSEKLQDLFYMVLMAGNFLNSVGTNNEVVQGDPSP